MLGVPSEFGSKYISWHDWNSTSFIYGLSWWISPTLFDFLIHFTKCLLDVPMTRKDMLETKQLTNSRFSRSTNELHQMSARDRLVLPHLVPVARCSEGQSVRPRRGETRLSEELLQQWHGMKMQFLFKWSDERPEWGKGEGSSSLPWHDMKRCLGVQKFWCPKYLTVGIF